jgi:hypothetical protein
MTKTMDQVEAETAEAAVVGAEAEMATVAAVLGVGTAEGNAQNAGSERKIVATCSFR